MHDLIENDKDDIQWHQYSHLKAASGKGQRKSKLPNFQFIIQTYMWVEIFDITDSCWIILKKIACYCFSIAFSAQKWLFWHILAQCLLNSRSMLRVEEIIFQIPKKSPKNGGKNVHFEIGEDLSGLKIEE